MRPHRRRPLPRVLAAAAFTATVLTACGQAASDADAAAPTTEATPAPATTPSFGFVHAVDASTFPTVVRVDDAEFFTGAEADAAAREDGHEVPKGGLPEGVYIRNGAPNPTEYPTVGNVVITIVEADGSEWVATPQQWEERVRARATGEGASYEAYHLTFVDGEIVEVRTQPLPGEPA